MTRVVVDASVVLASLMADGSTRGLLLGQHNLEFYAPEAVTTELRRHLDLVSERTGKSIDLVNALIEEVMACLEAVPTPLFLAALPSARRRARLARAYHDEAYVALADALGAPIWTLDKDFRRMSGLKVLTTAEVKRLALPATERSK